MNVKIKIYRTEARGDGEEVRLYISLSQGNERDDREAVLSAKQYFELGLPKDEITVEKFEAIEEAAEIWCAIKKGMGILLYGDNTAMRLRMKLTAHGYSRKSADGAVDYLEKMGLIDEEKMTRHIFESGLRKGHGRRRIEADMMKKGVKKELVDSFSLFDEIDFVERCATVIEKKWGTFPKEKKERDRAVRSLLSFGYTFDEINSAVRR